MALNYCYDITDETKAALRESTLLANQAVMRF